MVVRLLVCFVAVLGVFRWAGAETNELAPGVLIHVPPQEEPSETFSGPVPIVEIVKGIPDLDWTPKYDAKSNTLLSKASEVIYRRTVWGLDFEFKPVRMIEVDVPQPTGKIGEGGNHACPIRYGFAA